MKDVHDSVIDGFSPPSNCGEGARKPVGADSPAPPQRGPAQTARHFKNWRTCSARWGLLMAAAQRGERQPYEQLLRELDVWLRRYFARRLPGPAADDARQDVLLAVHAKRYTYAPTRPFGPWIAGIARHKWIDHLRNVSRFAATSLDDDIPTTDHGDAAVSTVAVDDLLSRLKPAQAAVIRLVKLQGSTIEGASGVTGQSVALVKVNIHRGLKKLTKLAAGDDAGSAASAPKTPRHGRSSA
jgi:RNA polymerase sigma factor (sigma-70 family)